VHGFPPLIELLILLAIAVIVVQLLRASGGKGPLSLPDQEESVLPSPTEQAFPYERESTLFSQAERSFLRVLEQALGDEVRVMGKVRLADVIKVRSGMSGSAWQTAFNRIQSKHLDFVVCDSKNLSVRFAVELDDQSHTRSKRESRDEFVDKALEAAGVPVFHLSAKRSYSMQEVRRALSETASAALPPTTEVAVPESEPTPQRFGERWEDLTAAWQAAITRDHCPRCDISPALEIHGAAFRCKTCGALFPRPASLPATLTPSGENTQPSSIALACPICGVPIIPARPICLKCGVRVRLSQPA
jgi:hypothetical protein